VAWRGGVHAGTCASVPTACGKRHGTTDLLVFFFRAVRVRYVRAVGDWRMVKKEEMVR
jgi:hypothetical protein